MSHFYGSLLDIPALAEGEYARLADKIGGLFKTRNDVVFVQAEAIVALEAAAAGLARPGLTALNVVTSPYGTLFGQWLRRGGANVVDLIAEPGLPIAVEKVAEALAANASIRMVSLVHAESASGILNPLPAIAELVRRHDAIFIVDAVASAGGHDLAIDDLGIDIAVIGPQKALGGSSGLTAVAISSNAWEMMDTLPVLTKSTLSLLDIGIDWTDKGRGVPPGMPSALEFRALEQAIARLEADGGLEESIARHALAARATRAGLVALGVGPWVKVDAQASALVTAAPVPEGVQIEAVLKAVPADLGITAGVGAIADQLVRLNHTGPRARFEVVLANVVAYGQALKRLGVKVNVGVAAEAVAEIYGES